MLVNWIKHTLVRDLWASTLRVAIVVIRDQGLKNFTRMTYLHSKSTIHSHKWVEDLGEKESGCR